MFVVVIPRLIQSFFARTPASSSSQPEEDETTEQFKIAKKRFDAATAYVPHVIGKIPSEHLHMFYALYKQATSGNADESQRPSFLDFKNKAKFDLWAAKRGMTKLEAMETYVEKLLQLNLDFDPDDVNLQTQGFGVKPSRMAFVEEQSDNDEDQDVEVSKWFATVKANTPSALKPLLDERPELLNSRDRHMNLSALHWSVDSGLSDNVITLLDLGADVNSIDEDSNTPLHYAALCGRKELVDILLSRGANMDAVNAEGEKPIDLCDRELLDYFISLTAHK